MTGEMIVIDIPWTGSLYEPSSDALYFRLDGVLNTALSGDVILLRAPADCHDYSNSWLKYLRDEAIWLDLVARLDKWNLLLMRMVHSKASWFFMADGDIVGSWWELALAAQGRISTNPYAKVGFPEVYIDLFPPIGLLGLRCYDAYDGPSKLRSNAILHAKDAFKLGVVDLCLLSDEWGKGSGAKRLQEWCTGKRRDQEIKSLSYPNYARAVLTRSIIEEARSDAKLRRKWFESARIDEGFEIARSRGLEVRVARMTEMRAAAAMRYLMGEYTAWLSRRVTRYRLGLHDRWWTGASELITIDISEGIPPQEIVKSLLARRKKIIFVAADPETLRIGLETMRVRFNRLDKDGKDAFALWTQFVTWLCYKGESYPGIYCRFNFDDSVTFSRGSIVVRYFRISGNNSSSGNGWYEDLNSPKEGNLGREDLNHLEEIQETVALVANGILKAQRQIVGKSDAETAVVPATIVLRFLLLEFILRLADRVPKCKSVMDLLKLMSTSGWGFSADPHHWESLLKTHKPHLPRFSDLFELLFPANTGLKIASLRTVMDHKIVESRDRVTNLDLRSGAAVTRQIEAFSYKVVQWLVRYKYVASLAEADLFVTLAWGYPGFLPLPHLLGETFGEGRIDFWLDPSRQFMASEVKLGP